MAEEPNFFLMAKLQFASTLLPISIISSLSGWPPLLFREEGLYLDVQK